MTDFVWGAITAQLNAAASKADPRPHRRHYNPRPPGVIYPGSATDAVLRILSESPGRFFTAQQLIRATGRTHAAVSFSLLYLRERGLVEAVPDTARSSRYLKYRSSDDDEAALKAEYDAIRQGKSAPVERPPVEPLNNLPDPALQNRDRSRAASVVQMSDIARNPDYMRLGPSRTPDSGAPMVFAVGDDVSRIPAENFGRQDVAVMSDGQRVPFRYAVVDASQVNPSNFADGRQNPEFASTVAGTIKALNNGRTAGVRAAYELGTAGNYKAELIADAASHGVPVEAIERTPNPILVRVYSERNNTADMAAKSQGQGLGMSPTELARQDAPLMDTTVLSVYEPGEITSAANRNFVRAFVGKLQAAGLDVAGMMQSNGELSQDGRKRIQAALMQAAYGDVDLVEEMFDSTDTDIKAIGEALKAVAGQWANMRDSARLGVINPQVDVTENLVQAVNLIRKARRERMSLKDLVAQPDLMTGETPNALTVDILRVFYDGQNFTRAVGRDKVVARLEEYIRAAMATSADAGLFGGEPVSPADILATITGQGALDAQTQPEEGRGEPAGSGDSGGRVGEVRPAGEQPDADRGGRASAEDRGAEQGQDAAPEARQQVGQGDQGDQGGDGAGQGGTAGGQQGSAEGQADRLTSPGESPLGAEAKKPARKAKGEDVKPEAPATAEQAIRDAFRALPSVTLGEFYPITVTHNGRTQQFLASQRALKRANQPHAALTLVQVRKGRMIAGDELQDLAYTYRLTGKNDLIEVSVKPASEELLRRWRAAGFGTENSAKQETARAEPQRQAITPDAAPTADEKRKTLPVEAASDQPAIDREKLDKDFRAFPTLILNSLLERGEASKLYKAAGTNGASAFEGLAMDDKAAAYVKFVEDGGKPVENLPKDYNAWVRSQERDIEARRLQSDRVVRQENGKPFKTKTSAQQYQERYDLTGTHEVVEADGGFELRQLSPSAQAELKRKAEGRESYTEAQAAVAAEMGIGQTPDGEWDVTDEQFDELERRTQARMRGETVEPVLTAPTREDVLAQQERAEKAEQRDAREQIRRESEAGAGMFSLEMQDGRQDTTGDLFRQPAQEQPSAQQPAEQQSAAEDAPKPEAGERQRNTFLTDTEQRASRPIQIPDSSSAMARGAGAMRDLYVYPVGKERETIREAFDNLVGEIKTRETEQGVTLFSRSPEFYAEVDRAIDAGLRDDKQALRQQIDVGIRTPEVLRMLGVDDKPVYTNRNLIAKMHLEHGVPKAQLRDLAGLLENPALVFESDTQPGRLLLVTEAVVNGSPVVVAVEPNGSSGRLEVVYLPSMYPRNDAQWKFPQWIRAGKLKYADKSRSRLLATTAGLELPGVVQRSVGFTPAKYMTESDRPQAGLSRGRAGGMTESAVRQVADTITSRWTQAPTVVVVPNMQDMRVPEAARQEDARQRAAGATGVPRAFYDRGTVYLVADGLRSISDAAEALFHEALGHYGLRAVFGPGLVKVLDDLAAARPDLLRAKAKEYGKDLGSQKERRQVAEEVLAEMAQTRPELGFVRRAIAAIRTWLRENVPALRGLRLTDDEIIRNYILPARGWVERGERAMQPGGRVAFMRAFHGTPHRGIQKFSTDFIGTGEGNQAFGWGLYFASRKEIAEHYRKKLSRPDVDFGGIKPAKAGTSADRILRHLMDKGETFSREFVASFVPRENLSSIPFDEDGDVSLSVLIDNNFGADDFLSQGGNKAIPFDDGSSLVVSDDGDIKAVSVTQGQLYEVEIPEDSEMLLWDKPLSEQPEKVREALNTSRWQEVAFRSDGTPRNLSGQALYESLVGDFAKEARQRVRDGEYIENTHAWAQREAPDH